MRGGIVIKKESNIKRYREIIAVIKRNGLGFLLFKHLSAINSDTFDFAGYTEEKQRDTGIKLRNAFEELGPAYIKLGQLLSTRTDIITPVMADELSALQDNVVPFGFDEAKVILENEFAGDISEVFESIDKNPVASGSVAQVYRAVLRSGETVAVKVKRPGVNEIINTDIRILSGLVERIEKHSRKFGSYDLSGMVNEFAYVLRRELDFLIEAENMQTVSANMKKNDGVKCPKVFMEYTSHDVITMEFIEGTKILDVRGLDAKGIDKTDLARRFVSSLLIQIIQDGFFQADPHPGNEIVLDDGTLVYIDLGMVAKLNESFRKQLNQFLFGLSVRNANVITRSILEMGVCTKPINERHFSRDIDKLLDKYIYSTLDNINILDVVTRIQEVAGSYDLKIPRDVTLVAKSLANAQHIVEILDPGLSIIDIAGRVAQRIYRNSVNMDSISENVISGMLDWTDVAREMPVAAGRFLRKVQENDFGLDINIKNQEKLDRQRNRATHLVAAAVFVLAGCIAFAGIMIALFD